MRLLKNKLFLKAVSFAVCTVFVLLFVAADHDRLQESARRLDFRYDRSSSVWKCCFKTGFEGFSAIDVGWIPGQTGMIELSPLNGPQTAVKTISEADAWVWPVRLHFPASNLQDWQLTVRGLKNDRPHAEISTELSLTCRLYAGKIPKSYYWFGVLAAGIFFILLELLERRLSPQPPSRGRRADFDYGIHYFRALAIFFIMLLHYPFLMPGMKAVNITLFSSSSYFFIFISGYLFYYLTGSFEAEWQFSGTAPFLRCRTVSGKFSVPGYYKKKLLNILLPYFLTASVIFFYIWLYSDTMQLVPAVPRTWQDYLFRIRTGAVQRSHWYIYFISKVFLISPLLLFLPKKWFAALTAASCVLPFVFTRVESHFLYFLPMYLLGMSYARYRAAADRILFHPAVRIAAVVLSIAGLIRLYPGREEQDGLIFVIRLLMTVDLLYLTDFLSRWKLPWLSYCADVSFTLFFVHDFIFAYMSEPVRQCCAPLYRVAPTFELLVPMIMIAAAIIIVSALKTLFGRFSRRIIGS
ncbi:MAG: acyltransferase [Lentisphaeria bacterium]|nr:acyltransferase [Lentisphaeria bacterium]